MAETIVIASLATIRLQAQSRLLATSCCPDKDLVVIISRAGVEDKMSLWKMQGTKKWEVSVNVGSPEPRDEITALNWSPDGQTIVVAHYPPRISHHSIQNGHLELSICIGASPTSTSPQFRLTGIWWFKKERKQCKNETPDIFRRRSIVPGSALSILRTQPLLDPLQDDNFTLNSTDLFAFQNSQARQPLRGPTLPPVLAAWPALPCDEIVASIKPMSRGSEDRPGEELDERDRTNMDSLMVVVDEAGQIHLYLDGTYSLGAIQLPPNCQADEVMKVTEEGVLLVRAASRFNEISTPLHSLTPIFVYLPLLDVKATRHIAENCSAARDLVSYTLRVVKEMKQAWFGGDGQDGARELNANYIRGLEERQAHHEQEVGAIFDLTVLLATGRSSSALVDFNQSGELTSERGLQKWESTVSESLLKLRDYSEKRVAPACQRLHLLLEEARGWSLLPQLYGAFAFSTDEIDECLDLTARAIFISAWLAAVARRELYRFWEFMSFLRYETSRLNASSDNPVFPQHDVVEVNEYFMSGLVVSSIDKWFVGPVPQFSLESVSIPHITNISSVLENARSCTSDASNLTWPPIGQKKDLSHLDRNLDALVHALAERSQRIYDRAAKAVTRTVHMEPKCAVQTLGLDRLGGHVLELRLSKLSRTRMDCDENGKLKEYLAVRLQTHEHKLDNFDEVLCIIRVSYEHEGGSRSASNVAASLLECSAEKDGGEVGSMAGGGKFAFHILDMDFFDKESLVVVYEQEGASVIGMVAYSDVDYTAVEVGDNVNGHWQEEIVAQVISAAGRGKIGRASAPIRKQRALPSMRGSMGIRGEGGRLLAVNGRVGRRVACVLDGAGDVVEMLDMEEEEEEDLV